MGARLNGIQEVTGSIPVRSTILRSPFGELRPGKPSEFLTGEGCRAVAGEAAKVGSGKNLVAPDLYAWQRLQPLAPKAPELPTFAVSAR